MTEEEQELMRFIEDFGNKILNEEAALFIGAGLSVSAGYVDWKNLLRPIAESLNLNVDKEFDLLSIPQYAYNRLNSQHEIQQHLIDSLTRDVRRSENHEIIARLPIGTLWTTNYDQLIEESYKEFGKRLDIKVDNGDLSTSLKDSDATLYKMHGCITHRNKIVLLKQDYEEYEETHNLFADKLRGDFIDKTFLFLGYSFSDPNIAAIIARVSSQQKDNKRTHYCITRIPSDKYDLNKYQYECRERQRYGIQTIGVNCYEQIPKILSQLETYITRSYIFLSGADERDSPVSAIDLSRLCRELSRKLINNGYSLVSGFGLGIMEEAIVAAYRAVAERNKNVFSKQLQIYPFPQGEKDEVLRKRKFSNHRKNLLSMSGVVIVVSGNKKDSAGNSISADGVREEVGIAKKIGRYVIPVGATGDVAAEICSEALKKPSEFLPGISSAEEKLKILSESKNIDEILDKIFSILAEIKEKPLKI